MVIYQEKEDFNAKFRFLTIFYMGGITILSVVIQGISSNYLFKKIELVKTSSIE